MPQQDASADLSRMPQQDATADIHSTMARQRGRVSQKAWQDVMATCHGRMLLSQISLQDITQENDNNQAQQDATAGRNSKNEISEIANG